MRLGIIGKPQSGKTTVFNAACGRQEAVGDYSKAAHRAVIKVPDERLMKLAALVKPPKITQAEIEFLDLPGLSGQGKQSTTFDISPELEKTDALIAVIDAFSEAARPARDIQDVTDELILADQAVLESSIDKKNKNLKLTGDKSLVRDLALLEKLLEAVQQEKLLIELDLPPDEARLARGYTLLTRKPLLVVLNIAEKDLATTAAIYREFQHLVASGKRELAVVCGSIEMELADLEEDERRAFLDELSIISPAVEKVIQKSYDMLGLISFFTAGGPELRAWPLKKGTVARKAAGVIHSDMERGFIRAETIAYEDYLEYKTPAALKAAGKTRLEGKDYVIRDGDVILFRFNV